MHGHLFLTGFMASGKSTVGRAIAQRSGLPFVDLDQRIAASAGCSVSEIFASQGEPAFRRLERAAVAAVLTEKPCVVALGGGALLLRSLRLQVLENATLICLRARPETLRARAAQDGPTRPLLQSDGDLELLLEQREAGYAEAHASIDVDSLSVTEIAERAINLWQRDPIAVASGAASYSVEVSTSGAAERVAEVLGRPSQAFVIIDETVASLYGARYSLALNAAALTETRFVLPSGEQFKNPDTVARIWQHAKANSVDRKARVVGIGGGVATDVAGFSAATWLRGVPWVSVPTTMLGMVDASVGGKTAVDLDEAKNCIGAFWQPYHVVCDVSHLQTESLRGFRSGLAEVVKTALLGDAALFDELEASATQLRASQLDTVARMVRRCVKVKASVVSRDPLEKNIRAALNLGHTIGHALESCDGYGNLTHGEAVSLGLVAALKVGQHFGVTEPALVTRATNLLTALGLPTDLRNQPLDKAAALLGHDKKRGGQSIKFVLTPQPGEFVFRDVPLPELQELTTRLNSF